MTIKYYLLCLTFLFFRCFALAQQSKIDSLLALLKTDKPDTNKVRHLIVLSFEQMLVGEYDKGLQYGKEGLSLSKTLTVGKEPGWAKGMAGCYINVGINYSMKGNYTEALKNYFEGLKLKEEIGDKKGIGSAYNNIGIAYHDQGNFPAALKSHFAALKIRKEIDDKKGVAVSLNNIGVIYDGQGNYPEALKSYFASLKIKEELGDKRGIGSSYGNIGNIYTFQGNYPEALKNHFASLKIHEELGNKNGIAVCNDNIANVYVAQGNVALAANNKADAEDKFSNALKKYFVSLKVKEELGDKAGIAKALSNIATIYVVQGNYPDALKNYFASLKLAEEIGNKEGIAVSYSNIGNLEFTLRHTAVAKGYAEKALAISQELGSKENIKINYLLLDKIVSAMENYKLAYSYYKMYIIYRDSLDNEETQKQTIQSQMTYDFEKKELATKAGQEKLNVIAAQEKQKQKIITYSVSLGLVMVLLLALFIFKGLRQKQKANIIITQQKFEVEHQKHLIEEKHKEITDSINYAERIQRSFLATKVLLDENLKDHFVFFQPKDVVSGDFYWATKLKNNNFILVTADSTGHGVPGAIMSILNISCLEKSVEEEKLMEPNEILNHTRLKIIERLKKDGSSEGGKDGMDASLISFDFKNSKLTYSAANNPVWIVRENQILELSSDKMPVGKHDRDSVSFTQHCINLQKGDVVYALTDGMPDQFGGPKGKKFMYKKLKELLISIAHLPMEVQKETLKKDLNDWRGNLEQVDDVCLIGVRV